ncbi:MAG: type 1 glutamine amidotransferase [Parascardovia denticolens]
MEKSQVIIFQHAEWEKPGRIADALEDSGIDYQILFVAQDKKPALPDLDSISGLVLMGGPMGAQDFDKYPGLKAEGKYTKAAVGVGVPTLGVCLGHQILATALGAKLKSGGKTEMGFSPVERESRDSFLPLGKEPVNVLHWHGDLVSCPEEGTILASTKGTRNQAFRYGPALGLQFHLEVDHTLLEEWLSTEIMIDGLKKSQVKQIRSDYDRFAPEIRPLADTVFRGFAARCVSFGRDRL